MIKTINLKDIANVEASIAVLEMEIELAKSEGITVLKLMHGYGSHGFGGVILSAVRKRLLLLKKQQKIKQYFNGDKWNIFEEDVVELLNKDKSIVGDVDLNRNNPGITIVVV